MKFFVFIFVIFSFLQSCSTNKHTVVENCYGHQVEYDEAALFIATLKFFVGRAGKNCRDR